MLRLAADVQGPNDFVPRYLQSHHLWGTFLATLRAHTLRQVAEGLDMHLPASTLAKPLPHVGPVNAIEGGEDAFRKLFQHVLTTNDIDIGSVCTASATITWRSGAPGATHGAPLFHGRGARRSADAYALGFTGSRDDMQDTASPPTGTAASPSDRSKRSPSVNATSAGSSPASEKKKRKKKRKNKNRNHAATYARWWAAVKVLARDSPRR